MLIYSSLFSLIQRFLCLIFSSRWFDGSIWEYLTVVHPIIKPLFPYRAQFNSIHFISPFLPIFPSSFSFHVSFPIFPLFPRNIFEQFLIFLWWYTFLFFFSILLYIFLYTFFLLSIFLPPFSLYILSVIFFSSLLFSSYYFKTFLNFSVSLFSFLFSIFFLNFSLFIPFFTSLLIFSRILNNQFILENEFSNLTLGLCDIRLECVTLRIPDVFTHSSN